MTRLASPPAVSVVIPCYNHGAFVDEAVESVLAQTFDDFEIVVVNDGSTDEWTNAHLASFDRPRTRVIHAPHRGLAAARNLGIANTAGRYICALDADDKLEPAYFARAVRVLDQDPSVAFVSCWLRTFGEEQWDWTPASCGLPALLWEDTVLTAALVRRDAVAAVGGYDEAMPAQGDEDWDLWLTLVERGYRGRILPEVLFHYRRRPGSMSSVCWHGSAHVPLARYRVQKHDASYRAHLLDVLLHQDAETAALLRRNDQLERRITTTLEPAVSRREAEVRRLDAKLAGGASSRRELELERALAATSGEVDALRGSMSWRITGPLRLAYGWWLRARGPA